MEFLKYILELLVNGFTGFIFGFFISFWLVSRNYKLVKYTEAEKYNQNEDTAMDDEHDYYVKLPDREDVIGICIEEPLGLNHDICLDGNWYVVKSVEHKDRGHTIFNLEYA